MAYISVNEDPRKRQPLEVQVTNPDTAKTWTKAVQITDDYDTRISGIKNFTLPAGAYYVEIRNTDPSNSQLIVNGEEIKFNKVYHRAVQDDKMHCIQDFVPEIVIQSTNTHWTGTVAYPSDSGLTTNAIFL